MEAVAVKCRLLVVLLMQLSVLVLASFSRCRDFVFLCDCWKTLFLFGAFGLWYSWLFLVLRKVLIYKSTLICKTSHQPSISWCNVWHGISHYSHGLMHAMCSSQTLVGVSRIVFFASCWVPKKTKQIVNWLVIVIYGNKRKHLWACVCCRSCFCLLSACLYVERASNEYCSTVCSSWPPVANTLHLTIMWCCNLYCLQMCCA